VKGLRRIVSKVTTKYGGDFTRCKDIARATACVDDLESIVALVKALLTLENIALVRCKNRFDPSWDSMYAGGYRDFQLQVLLSVNGVWRNAECQINLKEMVKIKEGPKKSKHSRSLGGHAAFDLARAIAAYDRRFLEHRGLPSDDLWRKVSDGFLLKLDVAGYGGHLQRSVDLIAMKKALSSKLCRLRAINLSDCGLEGMLTTDLVLWDALASAATLVEIDLSHNMVGFSGGGIAVGNFLAATKTVKVMNLANCHFEVTLTHVAIGLGKNTSITKINLSQNEFGNNHIRQWKGSDSAIVALAKALRANCTLQSMNLDENGIFEDGQLVLLDALKSNSAITEISLDDWSVSSSNHDTHIAAIHAAVCKKRKPGSPAVQTPCVRTAAPSHRAETRSVHVASLTSAHKRQESVPVHATPTIAVNTTFTPLPEQPPAAVPEVIFPTLSLSEPELEGILDSCRVLDPEHKGFFLITDLRSLMLQGDHPMSGPEVDEMVLILDPRGTGRVDLPAE
jgi:hypothetical protein